MGRLREEEGKREEEDHSAKKHSFNRILQVEKGFCEERSDALSWAKSKGSNLPKQSVSQIINQHGLYKKPWKIASLRSQNPYTYYALMYAQILTEKWNMNFESEAPRGVQVRIVNAPELPVSNRTTNVKTSAIIRSL